MAGKQIPGDGLSANLAGMSKNQLYDIMCQMKSLIEQNQQQARQVLIQNPVLTKALFQAQIMLGMVKPPQAVPKMQPQVTQNPQQTLQATQQSNAQTAPMMPGHVSMLDAAGLSQAQLPPRKQLQNQPSVITSSSATPALSYQQQSMPTHSLQPPPQPLRPLNPSISPISLTQSSQLSNLSAPPSHSQPLNQLQRPAALGQLPQSLQSGGFPHLPLQPPMPQQARPSATTFHSQYPPNMVPNLGPQHGGAPHNIPQSIYHLGGRPPTGVGSTFPQGQPSVPNLPPNQIQYQGGTSHVGTEFSYQMGNPMQVDRNSSWMASAEHSSLPGHPGQQSVIASQIGAGNQPSRALALSPEMEKQLLQQVMSLTQERINLLPPEQRNQVLQLQQVLRQ